MVRRDGDIVVKERRPKEYRLGELDEALRSRRTTMEATLLRRLPSTPELIDESTYQLTMSYVDDEELSDKVEQRPGIARHVGETVARMHDAGVHHGDLTTSNVLVGDDVTIIDLGLGGVENDVDDQAVDLYLFHKALLSRHNDVVSQAWDAFLEGYDAGRRSKILGRYEQVKKRGRYK